ncbi:MAG: hypothetical protein LBU66_07340 [Treponema sp.]|jgi:hypothetical protein|nr:hypothetical protein [Treponema sp.]
MIFLDTKDKLDQFFEWLEDGEVIVGGENPTEEYHAETSRLIREHKELRQKNELNEHADIFKQSEEGFARMASEVELYRTLRQENTTPTAKELVTA